MIILIKNTANAIKLVITINIVLILGLTYINIRRKCSKLVINNLKICLITNQNITFSADFTRNILNHLNALRHSHKPAKKKEKTKKNKINKQRESSRKKGKKSILKSKF